MCLAIPGQIMEISEDDPLSRIGKVRFGGVVKEVRLGYVPEAKVGDFVNVHVGFALSIIDEKEAQKQYDILDEMYQAAQTKKKK